MFDVWIISLDVEPQSLCLSPEEREQAGRFALPRLRLRHERSHSALRFILSSYLNVPPHQIKFQRSVTGKPYVSGYPLQFNLSHSAEAALCVVASGGAVGIDIEHIRPLPDLLRLARSPFSPQEMHELTALEQPRQIEAFYNGWTRKEAVVKATGQGLAYPLNALTVPLKTVGLDERLTILQGGQIQEDWSLYSLNPLPGYAAAVAIHETSAPGPAVRHFLWD